MSITFSNDARILLLEQKQNDLISIPFCNILSYTNYNTYYTSKVYTFRIKLYKNYRKMNDIYNLRNKNIMFIPDRYTEPIYLKIKEVSCIGSTIGDSITKIICRKTDDIMPEMTTIKRIIFNPPYTVVYWSDNTKTVCKVRDNEAFSKETGLAMCIAKKYCNNSRIAFKNLCYVEAQDYSTHACAIAKRQHKKMLLKEKNNGDKIDD